MKQFPRLAAITDEFSPDIEIAAAGMAAAGLCGAELRMLFGKNIVDLTDDEVDRAAAIVRKNGLEVIGLASPLLKCVLPDAPAVEERFQQDMFAAKLTYSDQERLAERTFEIARRVGARIVRVFSFWRTVEPDACFERIVDALRKLALQAEPYGVTVALENEHACNIATGAETSRVLNALQLPNLKVVWDPANALVAGEIPYPAGYCALPPSRIAHVHAKDCTIVNGQPVWGPLGRCEVDWLGQVAALAHDGYEGWISLETHWTGSRGDKFEASSINAAWLHGAAVMAFNKHGRFA
jgi:sugar phosphate isomerase/epimerase